MMEHKFVELAKEKLKSSSENSLLKKQLHQKQAEKNKSGMICSGEQTIWMYRVVQTDSLVIEKIISCLEQNKNGELKISPNEISFSEKIIPVTDFYFELKPEDDFVFTEKPTAMEC